MKRSSWLLAALVSASCLSVSAQDANYTEGAVSQVTAIQVTSGHLDEYLTYVRTEWKPEQEALKKAGIITDYSVYSTTPRTPNDPDLYLLVTYANMVRDSKRFADSGNWGYGAFEYDAKSDTFTPATTAAQPPQGNDAKCGFACHTLVKNRDYVFTEYAHR